MIESWRIVKAKHRGHAFDGEGSYLYGGRWNSTGTRIVYTAQSLSLAALEMLVHLDQSSLLLSYVSFVVRFEEALVERLDFALLPADWRHDPAPSALQVIGDEWAARQSSLVLAVPSSITGVESNFLINPLHPDFSHVQIMPEQPFSFDPRLK